MNISMMQGSDKVQKQRVSVTTLRTPFARFTMEGQASRGMLRWHAREMVNTTKSRSLALVQDEGGVLGDDEENRRTERWFR